VLAVLIGCGGGGGQSTGGGAATGRIALRAVWQGSATSDPGALPASVRTVDVQLDGPGGFHSRHVVDPTATRSVVFGDVPVGLSHVRIRAYDVPFGGAPDITALTLTPSYASAIVDANVTGGQTSDLGTIELTPLPFVTEFAPLPAATDVDPSRGVSFVIATSVGGIAPTSVTVVVAGQSLVTSGTPTGGVELTACSDSTASPCVQPSRGLTGFRFHTDELPSGAQVPVSVGATDTSTPPHQLAPNPFEFSFSTAAAGVTPTRTELPTETPRATVTATTGLNATVTATATATASETFGEATATASVTPTQEERETATPTVSATVTASTSASLTPSVTATPSDTATATATPSESPTATDTTTPTETVTSTPSETVTTSPMPTRTFSATPSPSPTASETPPATNSPVATLTPTASPTLADTDTPSPTETPTESSNATPTETTATSPTATETATETNTVAETPTPTDTPTESVGGTATATPTATATDTPILSTATPTPTLTPEIASLLVSNTDDSGPGSLRDALLTANSDGVPDRITFAPALAGQSIQLQSPLPVLTESGTAIDGDINGDDAPDVGLIGPETLGAVLVLGNQTEIKSLAIGSTPIGILVGSLAQDAVIHFNYVGVGLDGQTATGNTGVGISLAGSGHQIDHNVIAGNSGLGLLIGGTGIMVTGNTIGASASRTMLVGNAGPGITLTGGNQQITIGGTAPGSGNVIVGNAQGGIFIAGINGDTMNLTIVGNEIGGALGGNGSDGILINQAANVVVGGTANGAPNQIRNNVGYGVSIYGPDSLGVELRANIIANNQQQGIVRDALADEIIMPPVLSNGSGGAVTGTAVPLATLDFFITDTPSDDSGAGEAAQYLGSTQADANGAFQFGLSQPEGTTITATQTDLNHNTSAFALNLVVGAPTATPTQTPTPTPTDTPTDTPTEGMGI